MIGFPVFGDQPHNCAQMEAHGWGTVMDLKNVTTAELVKNVHGVLGDKVTLNNVQHVSEILHNAPMNPRETVAYWIDHVLRFGGGHLRPHSMDMAWYEYLMLDILAALITLLLLVLWLLYKLVSCSIKSLLIRVKKMKSD
jgi:glucuronosyltransferase